MGGPSERPGDLGLGRAQYRPQGSGFRGNMNGTGYHLYRLDIMERDIVGEASGFGAFHDYLNFETDNKSIVSAIPQVLGSCSLSLIVFFFFFASDFYKKLPLI